MLTTRPKILSRGADANAVDGDGRTALMLAVPQAQTTCFELLVTHGANVNARDRHGDTPLMYAASLGRLAGTGTTVPQAVGAICVRLLLSHGANVNATDNDGKTALQYARSFDHAEEFFTIPLLRQYRIPSRYVHHNKEMVKENVAAGATDPQASERTLAIAAIVVVPAALILAPLAIRMRIRRRRQ